MSSVIVFMFCFGSKQTTWEGASPFLLVWGFFQLLEG